MFDWLKSKKDLDEECLSLPSPTRPAPPELSEPVITLLEMLERDEWQRESIGDGSHILINVYNKDVRLHIFQWEFPKYLKKGVGCESDIEPRILCMDWLTAYEKRVLIASAVKRGQWLKALELQIRNDMARSRYKTMLGI
jgi:hypothetical protein